MSAQDTLNAAADLIEERGWWDGKGSNIDTICAAIAITDVSGGHYEVADPAFDLLLDRVDVEHDGLTYRLVVAWNDTHDEATVLRALRGQGEFADGAR